MVPPTSLCGPMRCCPGVLLPPSAPGRSTGFLWAPPPSSPPPAAERQVQRPEGCGLRLRGVPPRGGHHPVPRLPLLPPPRGRCASPLSHRPPTNQPPPPKAPTVGRRPNMAVRGGDSKTGYAQHTLNHMIPNQGLKLQGCVLGFSICLILESVSRLGRTLSSVACSYILRQKRL